MCWTITVPSPSSVGSGGDEARRAPSARRSSRRSRRRAGRPLRRGAAAGPGARRGRGGRAAARGAARDRGAGTSCRRARRRSPRPGRPPVGLATSSTAPSASASTARAPCAGENAETTTTAIGDADPAQLAQHADAVLAGHRQVEREHVGAVQARTASSASSPSRPTPTTCAPRSVSASVMQPAHEGRVVGDDDADGLGEGRGVRGHGGPVWLSAAGAAKYRSADADTREWGGRPDLGYAAIWTPANRPSGFSRIASRSPTLAIAST